MSSSFYTKDELLNLGFAEIGDNVFVSRKASFYNVNSISIGNIVRIDDFCILSGNISLGNYIHIAAYSALYGGNAGITIKDYANISSRVCVYAISDDYSGESMTNPMIPSCYKKIVEKPVIIEKNTIIGTGTTILPGVTLAEGTAIGAMSLVKESTESWGIYGGIPTKLIKKRSKKLLSLEAEFEKSLKG